MSFEYSEADNKLTEEDSGDDAEWQEEMGARYPLPLPKPGDVVFKTSANADRAWADKTFSRKKTYIDGYTWAADILFEHTRNTAAQIETTKEEIPPLDVSHWLVNPIYFLYRHAIELSLKKLLNSQDRQGHLALPEEKKHLLMDGSHNLEELWLPLKPWISRTVGDKLCGEIAVFEELVKEICRQDPKGDAGRYDVRRNKKMSADSFEGIRPIDVGNMRETFQKMTNFITWVWSLMQERGHS